MSEFFKRLLIFLIIIVVCSFLFNDRGYINTTSSISEIIDIVDKDEYIDEEELIIEKEEEIDQGNKNFFVIILEGVSTFVITIFSLVFEVLETIISSFTSIRYIF